MLGFSEVMHFQKQVGIVGVEIGGCDVGGWRC